MDLSFRSLSLSPLHLHHVAGLPPLGFSPTPPGLVAPRTRPVIRCNAEGADGSVQDKPAVKGASHGSWLQTDSKIDSYAGWNSDESHSNGSGIAGWVKIGGAIVLAVGFALGARSLYTRKEVAKEFATPVPVKEQVVSPSVQSNPSEMPENPDGSSLTSKSSENKQGGFVEHEREQHAHDSLSEMRQEDISPGQASLLTEDVEDSTEKEGSIMVSSAEATGQSEENLVRKEDLPGTSTIDSTVNSFPSEDTVQEESVTHNSVESPMDVNQAATEVSELNAFPVDSDGEDITPKALSSAPESSPALSSSLIASSVANSDKKESSGLSSQEKISLEDENRGELHSDPDLLNGFNVDLAGKDNLPSEEGTKLQEPYVPDFSLHNTDRSVQSVTSFKDFSSSSKESDVEKESVRQHEWDDSNADAEPASALDSERWHFSSAGLPAPSTPSAALLTTLGRVMVPAPVDHMQEQALAALQALKVIEGDVESGAICSRREYARWLIGASATLSRSPAHKVFPAMYIENVSELAYDDVLPEDPDFPFIQGLAEAGLISSKLLTVDRHNEKGRGQVPEDNIGSIFSPDSALTRQDLITWKIALERQRPLPNGITTPVGKEVLRDLSGFIDTDQIHHDACPALVADISTGERSIISLAFGYTRRFQPEKPVTKAQAAIALTTGEAWESVSEEFARLEAESIAEAAMSAELALEMKAQQEVTAAFNELLEVEKEKQEAAAQLAKTTRAELEKLKAEREEERDSLVRGRASLEAEKEFLSTLRHEVEEQALGLSSAKLEVAFEREQAEKLHAEAEEERGSLSKVRTELEIEKNALSQARIWAEDEARKAFAHAKVLEQARKRWEDQGVPVQVDKELDEANIPGPSWYYSEGFQAQKSPVKAFIRKSQEFSKVKSQEFSKVVIEAVVRFLQFIQFIFLAIRNKTVGLLKELGVKAHEIRVEGASAAASRAEGLKQTVSTSASGVASGLREGTRKAVEEWKGGAEKFAQKFKMS